MEKISLTSYDTYIKALTDISRAITSDLFIGDILKLIVLVTAKVTGMDICSLWLLEEGRGEKKLRLAATQAMDPEYLKERSLALGEGVVGYVAQHNRRMIIPDVLSEPRFKERELAEKLGLVSMLSEPLAIKDSEVIGVLNCFTLEPHEFTGPEISLVTTVANQASLAIHNTRLMVKARVIEEELATRKKIERAKEIVMTQRSLSADQAFRWLQKKSMDTRKSMKEIAEAVLLSADM
ncbi:MAG: ANTAR domain-containing protein [Proteobacteria bacterium]|nr:ANTAR domain-containing protein [Pseudomonadota bacterium]